MIKGFATPEGTARYSTRAQKDGNLPSSYRKFGTTSLTGSLLGFGSYRVDVEVPVHREALKLALLKGCNVIDTSTNYADGGSEMAVGAVLRELTEEKKLSRDEVIVVSKVGYVQGQNLQLAHEVEQEGNPFPEMVKYMDGCWHCIHPKWIDDQIDRSLKRTGLQTIDVYLLHNPEYFLSDKKKDQVNEPLGKTREEFYGRIEAAFGQMEQLVKEGKIKYYGVSSNTFVDEASDREATSLLEMLKAAEAVGGKDHHFRVVQLPANLIESGATLEKNNAGKTVLEVAQENNLVVLVNRPLNAIRGNSLLRLADFTTITAKQDIPGTLKELMTLEDEFLKEIGPSFGIDPKTAKIEEFFTWGHQLERADLSQMSVERWGQIQHQIIAPHVNHLVEQLNHHLKDEPAKKWTVWRDKYLPTLWKFIKAVDFEASAGAQKMSDAITKKLNPVLPKSLQNLPLSQKALYVLAHTPGVTCVLNGMREEKYVKDSMQVMKLATEPVGKSVYLAFTA